MRARFTGADAHEGPDRWYGGGELGLVTSHNARPALARPVRGFVGATVDYPRAHRDAFDGGPPQRGPASNQRVSVQWWLGS
jgi:hypothetical protein